VHYNPLGSHELVLKVKAWSTWQISMPSRDDNSKELNHSDIERRKTGNFTRAFGGKNDLDHVEPPSGSEPDSQRSLTQQLGSKISSASDTFSQSSDIASKPPASGDSFTNAFDGLNAFAPSPLDFREEPTSELQKQSRSELNSAAPGTFTRLFGSRDGFLTPNEANPDRGHEEPPAEQSSIRGAVFRQEPASTPSFGGSSTEAFSPPATSDARSARRSFTEEFNSPGSGLESKPLPSFDALINGSPRSERQSELPAMGDAMRPPSVDGGFTRLVTPPPDRRRTEPMRPGRPILEIQQTDHGPALREPISSGATIVFGDPYSELKAPGKSEYTQIVEASKLRAAVAEQSATASPSGFAASATPAAPMQYPPAPQPPQWQPNLAPPSPPAWGPPTPPPAPQPPAVPQLAPPGKLPTTGERLVQFLPLILTLSVVNTLGLLAVLIILFATRK
jgi:hypothetical protein